MISSRWLAALVAALAIASQIYQCAATDTRSADETPQNAPRLGRPQNPRPPRQTLWWPDRSLPLKRPRPGGPQTPPARKSAGQLDGSDSSSWELPPLRGVSDPSDSDDPPALSALLSKPHRTPKTGHWVEFPTTYVDSGERPGPEEEHPELMEERADAILPVIMIETPDPRWGRKPFYAVPQHSSLARSSTDYKARLLLGMRETLCANPLLPQTLQQHGMQRLQLKTAGIGCRPSRYGVLSGDGGPSRLQPLEQIGAATDGGRASQSFRELYSLFPSDWMPPEQLGLRMKLGRLTNHNILFRFWAAENPRLYEALKDRPRGETLLRSLEHQYASGIPEGATLAIVPLLLGRREAHWEERLRLLAEHGYAKIEANIETRSCRARIMLALEIGFRMKPNAQPLWPDEFESAVRSSGNLTLNRDPHTKWAANGEDAFRATLSGSVWASRYGQGSPHMYHASARAVQRIFTGSNGLAAVQLATQLRFNGPALRVVLPHDFVSRPRPARGPLATERISLMAALKRALYKTPLFLHQNRVMDLDTFTLAFSFNGQNYSLNFGLELQRVFLRKYDLDTGAVTAEYPEYVPLVDYDRFLCASSLSEVWVNGSDSSAPSCV